MPTSGNCQRPPNTRLQQDRLPADVAIGRGGRSPRWRLLFICVVAAIGSACGWLDDRPVLSVPPRYVASAGFQTPIFTSAHASFSDAVRDFLGMRPHVRQPIESPRRTHLGKGSACLDFHKHINPSPVADYPSRNTCL